MALDHVGDLVTEEAGQHIVGEVEVEHAAGDEDVAAGQGEGIGHRHLDQVEAEGRVGVLGDGGDPVADVEHPALVGRPVEEAVEVARAMGGLGALAVELGVSLISSGGCSPAPAAGARTRGRRAGRRRRGAEEKPWPGRISGTS